jgi:hypothetical protein
VAFSQVDVDSELAAAHRSKGVELQYSEQERNSLDRLLVRNAVALIRRT